MRADMYQVIIERPRGGAGWARRGPRVPWRHLDHDDDGACDGGPAKGPMKPLRPSKWLSENLAPLLRFLHSRVGRPWDQVHAEISQHIAVRSAVQKHVLDHLRQLVETRPKMIDGWPHHPTAYGRSGHFRPLYGRSAFYVCPETGRLLSAPTLPGGPGDKVHVLDARTELRRIDGVYYLIRLAQVPSEWPVMKACRDVLLKQRLGSYAMYGRSGLLERTYGRPGVYAVHKEQPSAQHLPTLLARAAALAAQGSAGGGTLKDTGRKARPRPRRPPKSAQERVCFKERKKP